MTYNKIRVPVMKRSCWWTMRTKWKVFFDLSRKNWSSFLFEAIVVSLLPGASAAAGAADDEDDAPEELVAAATATDAANWVGESVEM